ncbi:MAG TPA: zinc-binding dehydrogenase [Burkholderiales bacterium]|jgi:NADPH:quinone reductase-like Zn-dependent oxidoreductase
MKAFFILADGGRTRLERRDVPQPVAGPGQVLVKVRAAGLNRGEFIVGGLTKAGAAKPAGQEAAGEVVGTGQRVMGRCPGAFAEYALMDAREVISVPENLSWEEAASVPLTFTVVHDMLIAQGGLKSGEALLVTGVSSGVGVAALQAGKALGAKVIGTSGSPQKLESLKKHGLDVAIPTRKGDFSKIVLDSTDGKGANLAINTVGGSMFAELVRAAAFEGRIAIVGYVDGVLKSEFDLEAVHVKRLRIFGVSNKQRNAEQRATSVAGFKADLLPLIASGRIKPIVDKVFALDELEAAKAFMESDAQVGKIVVRA